MSASRLSKTGWAAVVCLLLSSLVAAQEPPAPAYAWDFNTLSANKRAPDQGTEKLQTQLEVRNWSKDGGTDGSGAVVCGDGIAARAVYFPRQTSPEFTVELSFKPAKEVVSSYLLDYAETSYSAATFNIFLDGKGHVGSSLVIRTVKGDSNRVSVVLLSKEHEFKVGEWTTVRVTMRKGGAMSIYVNGQLDMTRPNGPSPADFVEFPTTCPDAYPILSLGGRIYDGVKINPFAGMIDNVKIWKAALDADTAAPATRPAAEGSSKDGILIASAAAQAPVLDGKLDDACWKEAERTRPFDVLQHASPTVTGLWLQAEDKFIAAAASAQVCHDDKSLYVAFRVPVPPGMEPKATAEARDGGIWSDDCVELFLQPLKNGGFYQFAANAKGTFADLSAPPGGSATPAWNSDAQVKALRDENGFCVEMAIPFASLGNPEHVSGASWGINFTREGGTGGGLSTWAPVGSVFATPAKFGMLIFDSRKAYGLRALSKLEASLAAAATEGQDALVAEARRAFSALKERIERDGDRSSEWPAIQTAFGAAETQLRRVAAKGRTYMFWQKDTWGEVSPFEGIDPQQETLTTLRIQAALNMRAQGGFLVTNLTGKPLMGRLSVKKVTTPVAAADAPAVLDASKLRLYRGLYVELSSGVMVPDVMMPLPYFHLIEVPAQGTVPLWVEVDTRGLAAGRYARDMEFIPSYSGFTPSSVRLELEVAPVDPASVHVPGFTYQADPNSCRHLATAKDFMAHGLNTIHCIPMVGKNVPIFDADGNLTSYDWSILEQGVDSMLKASGGDTKELYVLIYFAWNESWYRNLGTEATVKFGFGTDGWKRAFANWIAALRDFYLKKGFTYEQIAIKTLDEPSGDPADPKSTASIAVRGARYIKDVDPKMRTMCNPNTDAKNAPYLDAYLEVYDILEPYIGHVESNQPVIDKLRRSGRELRTYGIFGKETPPSAFRNLYWFSAANGFSGCCAFGYYIYNTGDAFNSYDSRPDSPGCITDYSAVYLMSGAEEKLFNPACDIGPLTSRRYEAWYHGNLDFRIITVCRGLISRLQTAGKADLAKQYADKLTAVISKTEGQSCAVMDAARATLLQMAVSMQNKLPK